MDSLQQRIKPLLIAGLVLGLAACGGSTEKPVEPQVEIPPAVQPEQPIEQPTPLADPAAEATPIAEQTLTARELLEQTDTPLASRVIYFDFDSASIRDESLPILEAHGIFIAENANVTVRLEGHTDERGSREYNIALGDRRAQSVRRLLLFQGASSDQVDTVSYGEEVPADPAHTEEAWQQNRRVELVYQVN